MSDQMSLVVSTERERGESLQDDALEGQRHLEGTVQAAHEILASLNEVLCNPLLWTQPVPDASNGSKPGGTSPQQEQGWLALETGRLRYKATTAALRASINNIFNNPQEGDSDEDKASGADLEQLETQVAQLREEAARKNQLLKLLIDQSRDLVSDLSMWQTSPSLPGVLIAGSALFFSKALECDRKKTSNQHLDTYIYTNSGIDVGILLTETQGANNWTCKDMDSR
ncbi:hypothetical protein R1flu_007655 [Riccia fluitans]|uniref:Mediator of RNA polymerase II transcription subunit 30 n=1 Tax=Riccia fluitans TaxID=41844 RepID=A0ABD1YZJ7_9MARC